MARHQYYCEECGKHRFDGLRIGRGNAQWGAPADRDVFVISLGEIYK